MADAATSTTPAPLFDMVDLERAVEIVRPHVPVTPTYAWPLLAAELGTEVWVKHENTTPTGAFKVRGGLVLVERLCRERPDLPGIVSATRGNHGQSLAFAGGLHGVPVTIVVPEGNSTEKNAAMVALGARLVVHGRDYQAAREHAQVMADRDCLEMVGPFERDLVLGVATYALELFSAQADLDVVYVPVGMGSGICGLMGVRDLLDLPTEIVGVVAEGAPATLRSFEAGRPVATDSADTFVDGVATRIPDPVAIALICAGAARIIAVSDDDAREAMRVMHRCTHSAAEPSGALALAGARAERELVAGRRVGLIHSGANADAALVASVLRG
jgi:threonine dehydratase